ncbi:hypothetical protein N789_13950 [Arenimonas oryziterrae DSM 21050 = YC6267]|uniref:Polyketide cyclase n=2 Tax=Arenimonas TaxID=490567 RepID=A0A091BDL1_9GAMM|nr:hypothetical protein N789_13950 [Arenimonas oryziterrae DSM 21050 = YC6267]
MTPIQVQLEQVANARVALAFKVIVAMDLTLFLTGYGWLPAAVHVSRQTGPWNAAGTTRRVHFADGNSAFEEVLEAREPFRLLYRITGFTSFMRLLAREIEGEWLLSAEGEGTRIVWRYTFQAKSRFTGMLLRRLVRGSFLAYMRQALARAVHYIEANAHLSEEPRR